MDKFNRNYQMFIDTNDGGQLRIEKPFTVEFNIVRNTLSSANQGLFRIYNLNSTNRARILKDRIDFNNRKTIAFYAGYNSDLPLCFNGTVRRCYSERQGTNIVTTIEADDAGFAFNNALLEKAQYPKGTSRKNVLKDLIKKLKDFGVNEGKIGDIKGSLLRTNSFGGPTINAIQEISGGTFFIDNGVGYILKENEIIDGAVRVINSDTGLLGTPIRDSKLVEFSIIFEPRIVIAQGLSVESSVYPEINNQYKVTAITHNGMISETVAGTAVTKISCFYGKALTRVT